MTGGTDPETGLPEAFAERLREAFGDDVAERVLAHAAGSAPLTVRVNALVATPEEVLGELAPFEPEPVGWYDHAFVLRAGDARGVQETDAFRRGALYLQGLSSMVAPLALAPEPGEHVLDATAAPGSKTSQLAAMLGGTGELVANDRSRNRVFKLRAVLEHQRVEGVQVFQRDAAAFGRTHVEGFDRVLLDAPCSGEGRFRTDDPASFADWKPSKVKRLAAEQRRLLLACARAVKPGGVLVYSTCTFAPEENESVVQTLLRREDDFELEELDLDLPTRVPGLASWRERPYRDELARCVRILPDADTSGFFVARLRRRLRPPV